MPVDRQSSTSFLMIQAVAFLLGLIPGSFVNGSSSAMADEPELTPEEAVRAELRLVSRVHQMTYEGRRAGEGYFSADGSQMVFQSEREAGNPFFQIYVTDLRTGETERVSPGQGKTTCAWIHPDGNRVLYSSTHEDPEAAAEQQEELDRRASGREKRYSWDYDEYYEIYELNRETGVTRALTRTKGYDAEGSWSPDGSLIAFASNRSAWTDSLTDQQKETFALDPAWANEIYLMDADGGNVRRLTTSPGYDGGPFFSPDGQRICWRRFTENGAMAEIMTMKIDGTDQTQLTHLEAMSWAPYYHPGGRYLIFTTNRHGFANFELYLVRADGQGEPVRVTYTDGFDGLPVFTPDGHHLAWTTNRTANGQSQIFMGDWDHTAALQLLGLPEDSADRSEAAAAASTAMQGRNPAERGQFEPADALRHVEYLCRPALEGRMTGTRGEKLATNYVALHFETIGLLPDGPEESWFQEFTFTSGVSPGENNLLKDGSATWTMGQDFLPLAFSRSGTFEAADVVFAGYGIRAPGDTPEEEYDSYVHLDVKDKWVLAFRFMPEGISAERRQQLSGFSSARYKAMQARDLGARGLILVSGPNSQVREQLIPLRFDGTLAGSSLPVLSITDQVAEAWFQKAGKDLKAIQSKLDTGDPVMGFLLEGVTAEASVELKTTETTGRNVLGRLQLGDEPSQEVIVVGAHIDHLGKGRTSGSLARDEESEEIHFGADDNASGVAAMLQIAEALAAARDSGSLSGRRDIIFAAWSGEELGLLGSSHYVARLESAFAQHAAVMTGDGESVPAEGTDGEDEEALSGPNTGGLHMYISAALNMDMVGRLQEKLVLQGLGSSSDWDRLVEQCNVVTQLPLTLQQDSYLPTDASVFFLHGVPILSAFTGNHGEYHTPRDTPEKINYEGVSQIARLMSLVCRRLIAMEKAPTYVAQQRSEDTGRRASLRAYLGSIPDYAQGDVVGVKLSGVAKGGPSDKGGIRGGDVIVGLAGKKIENIYDYTYAIEALKIGQEVEVQVRRDGKVLTMKVTPGSRD